MFIKLLTIITALFVSGGVNSPPTLHKQRQPNTIIEPNLKRDDYDMQFYNIFDPHTDIINKENLNYNIISNSKIEISNFQGDYHYLYFTMNNFVVGNSYFFYWEVENVNGSLLNGNPYIVSDLYGKSYDNSFVEVYKDIQNPNFYLSFRNGASLSTEDKLILKLNIFDLTSNPFPYIDTTLDLWTENGLETSINEVILKNNPLYSLNYNLTINGTSYSIPIPLRDNDYTHIYKSDLYNSILSRVGNVPNNFSINISLPMKNTRDLNIFAKGNDIVLKKDNISVYHYTQGNNIFSINLPYDNSEFNFISLSFFDFNSISANDVVLSVSTRIEETSYKEGYDKGYNQGDKDGYDKGQQDGYNEGYEIGHGDGFQVGYDKGNTDGYDIGYNKGYNEGLSKESVNPFSLVSTAFDSIGKILSVNLFGGFTIATLVAIPFMFLVVLFILKLMKG